MKFYKDHYDVIVIGGALAGLSSALMLADKGLSVLVLERKAAGSANSDPVGLHIPVADYAKSGTVITKASGGTPSAGDEYEVYPKLGAAVGGIASLDSATRSLLTVTAKGATKLKCVGHDYDRHRIRLMAVDHSLGTED